MSWHAVVLAGGRGTRFWPLSRRARPKQCLSFDGGPTLLQRAAARSGLASVIVVTGPDMEDEVRAQVPDAVVLVEPSSRNTAPAIALAAGEVARRGGEGFVVLPSDHLVADEPAFRVALGEAIRAAGEGALVTLGVTPTRAETGFGWIEPGEGGRVLRFVEKPGRDHAERLFAGGRHLWNAGMFVWRVDALLDALERHLPGARATADARLAGRAVADVWTSAEATSIDHGLMEHADNVRVVPLDAGWSDVGSWAALGELRPEGLADAIVGGEGSVVHAPGKLVALSGVEGLVVVDTPDVLLVARRDDPEGMRILLAEVERRGLGRYT